MSEKNIILIALDGVRLDMMRGLPTFKGIQEKGLLFNNVTAYAPHSIASFHAIFTGIYGCHNGVDSYFGTLKFKEDQCKTLTEYCKDQGFYCFGDTMNDLVIPKKGFDKLQEQKPFEDFREDHKRMVKEIKEKNDKGEKCFIHLHCSYAHNDVVEKFIKGFKGKEEEFYKDKESNKEAYNDSLKNVDTYVKEIWSLLEENNLVEESIIVIFSDHGTSIGEKKGERAYGTFCYEYSLRTFCLFLGKPFPVKEISQNIRNVDITPTILQFLKIEPDTNKIKLDGKHLQEFIDSPSEDRTAFAETGGIEGPWPSPKEPNIHIIKDKGWKLIFNRTPTTFELYNLNEDPSEENNLLEKNKEKAEELKAILAKFTILP